ncbi:MAG TPA: thiamine pyrophosphate-binding protein [Thermoanaerobaculia bacterium]|nr:thiamine pyrophosphate-binding protein [Thermoanaerobaculia bacterium]
MAETHGGDVVATVLARRGVRTLFTLCGGHISSILVGARARGIEVVDTRHEAAAVFAADACARLTGVPGVAAVTAGPGLTNTVTAVENARLAQSPVLVLGGAAPTVLRGRGALQDIDQQALARPLFKWSARAERVADLAPLVERALWESQAGVPGPVFVECAVDLLYPESLVRSWYGVEPKPGETSTPLAKRLERAYLAFHLRKAFGGSSPPPGVVGPVAPPLPEARAVRKAARALARSERPVLVVGSQATLQVDGLGELVAAIERLGVPTWLSGMARGLLGAEHRLLFRHRRKEALREADLVLLAGVPCDFRLDYGRSIPRRATLVSANRSEEDLARNRRPEIASHGDAALFLRELARRAEGAPERGAWLEALRRREAEREREIAGQAAERGSGGVNPLSLLRAIDGFLDSRALLVADGGDFVGTASYVVRPRSPLSWLDPGAYGTLGVGGGFALGARAARPESEIWILFGDGSVGYSLAEFDTFARHGVPVVAVVGNDGSWAQIARDQVEVLGDDVGTVLARSDYHRVAEALGGRGLRIEREEEIAPALEQARAWAREGSAVLINAILAPSGFRKGSISL